MRGVRGADKAPGEVRQSQNWIGGSRPGNAAYVPPPPHALGELLGAFEKYIHAEDDVLGHEAATLWAVRLFELLPRQPLLSVATAMRLLKTSKPTATRAIEVLVSAGVLGETTGRKRDRWFAYGANLARLRVGTDLDPTQGPGR